MYCIQEVICKGAELSSWLSFKEVSKQEEEIASELLTLKNGENCPTKFEAMGGQRGLSLSDLRIKKLDAPFWRRNHSKGMKIDTLYLVLN